MPLLVKYGDFSRNVNDFFGKEFPFGFIKVEARTFSRNPFISRPVGGMKETFSDEFKVVAVRNLDNGAIAAEVKNTTSIPLPKLSTGMSSILFQAINLETAVINRCQERNYFDQF